MAFKARSQGQSLFNSRASPNTHFSWKIQLSGGSQSLDIQVLEEVGHLGWQNSLFLSYKKSIAHPCANWCAGRWRHPAVCLEMASPRHLLSYILLASECLSMCRSRGDLTLHICHQSVSYWPLLHEKSWSNRTNLALVWHFFNKRSDLI